MLEKLFGRKNLTSVTVERKLNLNRDYWMKRQYSDGDRAALYGRPEVRVAELLA